MKTSHANSSPPAETVSLCIGGEVGAGLELAPFKDGYVLSPAPKLGLVLHLNGNGRFHPSLSIGGKLLASPFSGGVTKGGLYLETRIGGGVGDGPINLYALFGGALTRLETDLRHFEIVIDGETQSIDLTPHTQAQFYVGAEIAVRKTTRDGSIVEFAPLSLSLKPLTGTFGNLSDGTPKSLTHTPLAFETGMALRVTSAPIRKKPKVEETETKKTAPTLATKTIATEEITTLTINENIVILATKTTSQEGITTLTINGNIVIPDDSNRNDLNPQDKAAQGVFKTALQDESVTRIIIDGHLSVNDSDLTDLTPLKKVVEVKGHFHVTKNPKLVSLTGLQNLERVGGDFLIMNNPALRDLGALVTTEAGSEEFPALSALTHVGRNLYINGNVGLEEINGFPNLIEVGALTISFNHPTGDTGKTGLKTISGFNKLASIKSSLSIQNNLDLETISGFGNLVFVEGISIRNNHHLQRIQAFDKLKRVLGKLTIEDNTDLAGIYNFFPRFIYGLERVGVSLKEGDAITMKGNPKLDDLSFLNELNDANPDKIQIETVDLQTRDQMTGLLARLRALRDSGQTDDYEANYLFNLFLGDEDDFVRQKALEICTNNIAAGRIPQETTLGAMATAFGQIIIGKGDPLFSSSRPVSDQLLADVIFSYCTIFKKYDPYNKSAVADILVADYLGTEISDRDSQQITVFNLIYLIANMSNPTLISAYQQTVSLQGMLPQEDPKITKTFKTGLETLKQELEEEIGRRNLKIPG